MYHGICTSYLECVTALDVRYVVVLLQKAHNLSLPSWVNKTWNNQTTYDKLREMVNVRITLAFSEPVLSRLTGGLYCQLTVYKY